MLGKPRCVKFVRHVKRLCDVTGCIVMCVYICPSYRVLLYILISNFYTCTGMSMHGFYAFAGDWLLKALRFQAVSVSVIITKSL